MTQYGCARHHTRRTPTISLVMGNDWRYWSHSPERGQEGWDRWINQTMKSLLRKIHTEQELIDAQFEPKDGGSTFYAQIPSENHSFLETFRNHSKFFKIYNDTFVYSVNSSLTNPIVTAYQKPGCPVIYNSKVEPLYAFFDRHKFGALHKYPYSELSKIPIFKVAALYFVKGNLKQVQRRNLQLAAQNECSNTVYGWVDMKEEVDEKENSKYLRFIRAYDLPLMVFIDRRSETTAVWKKALLRAKTELIPNLFKKAESAQPKVVSQPRISPISLILGTIFGIFAYFAFSYFYPLLKPHKAQRYNEV
ncbi:hypothetical protein TVAG_184040 [Trichomonas vaginalis G3]|uniref:Uncharacterized protein n=1 Tax=Trichomonas vaginalis (strain ATCC PRA-98 / G3) TaxID=412133 RepID=A2D9E0_TRIV3|nr:hypothetical protein TVAGG3_0479440 [Trichomonas vaginalis G3]EAY23166.1 hypothetical protein TVAG_184040 [Trichomonas vaginalis G3]KAI5515593.1 hypothetical protein TVAGG3_0479440 [Trichomonas vaginalis G3]|eukprot:XP_001584152.1 hypothetical protein [Trichomonas vaginalis G3]